MSERSFKIITAGAAAIIVFLLVFMGIQMYEAAQPAVKKFGWSFVIGTEWDYAKEEFGALPFIAGTVLSSFIGLLIAFPLGIGIALFLSELTPTWLSAPLTFIVDLLAAIPSIVYGLWGIFVLVPWVRDYVQPWLNEYFGFLPFFQGSMLGVGLLAAGLILSIMILPIITAVSRDVIQSVPRSQKEASYALGATWWETMINAVIPHARSGLLGAAMLGLGRALGETMAVAMVIGGKAQIPKSLFDPAQSMAGVIANEYAEATSEIHLASLIELGLILFLISLLLNIVARLLVWRVARGTSS